MRTKSHNCDQSKKKKIVIGGGVLSFVQSYKIGRYVNLCNPIKSGISPYA